VVTSCIVAMVHEFDIHVQCFMSERVTIVYYNNDVFINDRNAVVIRYVTFCVSVVEN